MSATRDGSQTTTVPVGARDSTLVIHAALRESILMGEVKPGTWMSQVELAKRFGVSRGPVREAMRLLEREGLVTAQVNQRARVAEFSPDDLEQLYAARIVNEALAIAISVPRFTLEDLAELEECLEALDALTHGDLLRWEEVHRDLHRRLVKYAGARTDRMLEQFYDHSERYRRVYITGDPRAWSVGRAEHRGIVDACRAGDPALAAGLLARHLARTALTSLVLMAPEHDAVVVRGALRQATALLDE